MLVTPGNHDTPYWNIPLRALQPFKRYKHYVGRPRLRASTWTGCTRRMINTSRGFSAAAGLVQGAR